MCTYPEQQHNTHKISYCEQTYKRTKQWCADIRIQSDLKSKQEQNDRLHAAERSIIFKSNRRYRQITMRYYRSTCLSLVYEKPSRSNLKNQSEHSVPPGAHMTTQPMRKSLQTNSSGRAACSLATKAQHTAHPAHARHAPPTHLNGSGFIFFRERTCMFELRESLPEMALIRSGIISFTQETL